MNYFLFQYKIKCYVCTDECRLKLSNTKHKLVKMSTVEVNLGAAD